MHRAARRLVDVQRALETRAAPTAAESSCARSSAISSARYSSDDAGAGQRLARLLGGQRCVAVPPRAAALLSRPAAAFACASCFARASRSLPLPRRRALRRASSSRAALRRAASACALFPCGFLRCEPLLRAVTRHPRPCALRASARGGRSPAASRARLAALRHRRARWRRRLASGAGCGTRRRRRASRKACRTHAPRQVLRSARRRLRSRAAPASCGVVQRSAGDDDHREQQRGAAPPDPTSGRRCSRAKPGIVQRCPVARLARWTRLRSRIRPSSRRPAAAAPCPPRHGRTRRPCLP